MRLAVQRWLPSGPVRRFARRRLRGSWFDRAVLWLGGSALLAWGGLVVLVTRASQVAPGQIVSDGLLAASWTVGMLAALGAARPLVAEDEGDGVRTMMAVRGLGASWLQSAYLLAAAARIARVVAFPVLLIWLLALMATNTSQELSGFALLPAVILVYSAIFGTALAALARWGATWVPGQGRPVLLALVVVPHLAGIIWPSVPSLPSLFRALVEALVGFAGGLA